MMSVWSTLLVSSVAIGFFLLSLLLTGRKTNAQATYLFSALVLVLVANNADNWVYASGLWQTYPLLVGFARASILLIGPIIYLYARSITDPEFDLRWMHLLHVVPYAAAYSMIIPQLYLYGADVKREFIRESFESRVPLGTVACFVFAGYLVQLTIYLWSTIRLIRAEITTATKVNLIVSAGERIQWITKLAWCFGLCYSLLFVLFSWTIFTRTYRPEINFSITTAYTLLIYYLGVYLVRHEHLILADFVRKYQSLNVTDEQRRQYMARLGEMVEKDKIYLDPELTLGKVAGEIGIPAGYLSKLINEEHGKSFPDFINQYRIEEVKRRLKDPRYDTLSIFGVALEVGFNSKSSFNAAFKNVTGMTPSDYKKS